MSHRPSKMLLAAWLASAASVSCALPPTPCAVSLEVDSAFTSDEKRGITDAAHAWNDAIGEHAVTFAAPGEGEIAISRVLDVTDHSHAYGGYFTAWDGSQHIELEAPKSPFDADPYLFIRHNAAHEIGHALGFEHTTHGIMATPTDNWTDLPTPEDAKQCR